MIHRSVRSLALAGALLAAGLAGRAQAAEIVVMSSGGLTAAIKALAPAFETASGHTIKLVLGPSMGTAPEAIPQRLERGEPADVLLMVGSALDGIDRAGKILPGTGTPVADSKIAAAVKAGAPQPDISSLAAFKAALLAAKSVAYSDSASGVYIEREMYRKLGIEPEMKGKSRMIVATPVGEIVARGEAELGFQQLSELLPVRAITILGLIPEGAQQITPYKAGIPKIAREPEAGRALIAFMRSPEGAATIKITGLEPVGQR